jgi:two-component system response regulator AtoC
MAWRARVPIKRSTVWVVDDDTSVCSYLSDLLESRGYEVVCFDCGEQAVQKLNSVPPPSLLLLDVRLPNIDGLGVLAALDKIGCRVPSIVISGVAQIPTAVEAMRLGASDYLLKPLDEKELDTALARVLAPGGGPLELDWTALETAFQSSNRRMLRIQSICDKVADTDVPVLLLGESGVGKEVVARYIHERSGRREPFIKVNCAALPTDLLESELFGHERGAFTGAQREKPGKFELARRGTIMLDEVAEMSPFLQAKLLHILQDGEYSRLGGVQTLTSEARILTATNKCLDTMVASGGFREDLYFRLNVIRVEIPPLRERPEDIVPLCHRFFQRYRAKYNSPIKELPLELLKAFEEYHWPGNVRQLENAVKRFLILLDVPQAIAEIEDRSSVFSPTVLPKRSPKVSLKRLSATAAEHTEKELVFRTLKEVNWNRKKAAGRLGICYKSLLNKLHRWQGQSDGDLALVEEAQSKPEAARED